MIQRPAAPAVACREAVSGLENSSVASFPCLETGRGQFATYYIPLFAKFYPSLHSMAARLQKQCFQVSATMRSYIFLTMLLCALPTLAQNSSQPSFDVHELLPRPFIFGGAEGMGANYHPFALLGGAGFRVDSDHLILDLNGSYDDGRKDN